MISRAEWLKKNLSKIDLKEKKIGVYGTGKGALELLQVLKELGLKESVVTIIDNDSSNMIGQLFEGKEVQRLESAIKFLDVILVAAVVHHREIYERLQTYMIQEGTFVEAIDAYVPINTSEDCKEYVEYMEKLQLDTANFVELSEDNYEFQYTDTKIIAFYLPQYHQIEINNIFHGQGFTEWINTSQAKPLFTGHYQPHIPYDVGYYDLKNVETFERQIYLAKKYGVYGFAFHYYWFSGERLMEKPLELLSEHKELKMPFCVHWANESWTNLWDGGKKGLMFEQKILPEEAEKFIADILVLFKDERYICIDEKPLLMIYRTDYYAKDIFADFVTKLRECAKQNGFKDLYIMITTAKSDDSRAIEWGADALVEYPPHRVMKLMSSVKPKGYLNPNFVGTIYDTTAFIERKKYLEKYPDEKYFRTAMTNYDNSARKAFSGAGIYWGLTPDTYKQWLIDIIRESKEIHTQEEDMVFVNAWNEWAEAAHLEPDMKYGYAYLQKTLEALVETH